MVLTVLGASGTYPRPGGACNGFLIQEGGYSLVIELGNGCLSNLLREVELTAIDAVVVTHMHIDHFGDLYPLYYALRFHPLRPWGLRLILPEGGLELLGCILGREAREYLPIVFREERLQEGVDYEVGGIRLRAFPTRHPVEGYALRVEGDGWALAYSSDTSPTPSIEEAARDADLFICEATLPDSYREEASHGHMTSRQAGEAARRAGARRLLLTHIWPTFEPEEVLAEAAEAFGGEAEVAREGMRILLGGGGDG
ncbi:MBL fold metallo-hydrolase [Candidatus Solincola tengchongensis]|uniref:MBL fold metallo-hydrolase n=1 Tax=Candidatus Solincola tengchongensis TaxID=2900693 RepID=UPI00257B8BD4|nr:MBL fold metallo-hydrolase [Candidatus Solincola tengchongensis]